MSSDRGLRIAVAGATGAVGAELLALLDERRFPISGIVPFATERSLGRDVEIGDEVIGVEGEMPRLAGFDLLFVCTPRGVALELVREALRAEVACIDCSGALLHSEEVPLGLAELSSAQAVLGAPVVTSPPGPALAWCRLLAALDAAGGVERVVGTVLQGAAHGGVRGIDALSAETIALLRQEEAPPSDVFPTEVAFDCVPRSQEADSEGLGNAAEDDGDLGKAVDRVLGRAVGLSVQRVQVPAFVGEGSALCVELAREIDPEETLAAIDKTPGLARWTGGVGPTTRDAAGGNEALVSSLRRDPRRDRTWLLWLAADPIRLAALNAVKLAELRLRLH